jgi:transcriptional regulator GlxA family with amidase domain
MKRRNFLLTSGLLAASAAAVSRAQGGFSMGAPVMVARSLPRPDAGKIRVAFAIDAGTQVIDLAGPWEVFQDVRVRAGEFALPAGKPFELYTVGERAEPLAASGGLMLVPTFTLERAPVPHVLVVPHFETTAVTAIHEWMKQVAPHTTLTMSVCTGAFQLAKTGLLDGRPVTTNGFAFDEFEKTFPKVKLLRGPRFVESDGFATSGGLTAGIDLALRVVERFFNSDLAGRTADAIEYSRAHWR